MVKVSAQRATRGTRPALSCTLFRVREVSANDARLKATGFFRTAFAPDVRSASAQTVGYRGF